MYTAGFHNKDIVYNIQGMGDPLVLIHGYLMSSAAWGDLPRLLAKQYKVIIPDLPGHGISASYTPVHSMELMAEALKAILDNEGIDNIHLIGHSMGGYVALAFLEQFPDVVKSLTLLNTTPFADTSEKLVRRDEVIKMVHTNRVELFLKLAIKELLQSSNQSALRETLLEQTVQQGKESIIATTQGMKQRHDRSNLLKDTPTPLRWIMGSNDNQFDIPEILNRAKKEGLPEVKLLETGHMSFLEQPNLITEEVERFILSL